MLFHWQNTIQLFPLCKLLSLFFRFTHLISRYSRQLCFTLSICRCFPHRTTVQYTHTHSIYTFCVAFSHQMHTLLHFKWRNDIVVVSNFVYFSLYLISVFFCLLSLLGVRFFFLVVGASYLLEFVTLCVLLFIFLASSFVCVFFALLLASSSSSCASCQWANRNW